MRILYRIRILTLFLIAAVLFNAGCSRGWSPNSVPLPQGSGRTPSEQALVHTSTPPAPGIFDTGQGAAAPTPTAGWSVDPTCLAGAWQVVDLSRAMADSYARSESTFQLQQMEGAAYYEFTTDGGMRITFDHMAADFSGILDGRQVVIRQSIDGSATARYSIDPVEAQLILSNFGDSGILFSLAINQQVLVEGGLPIWQAFTSAISPAESEHTAPPVQSARAAVDCAGDSLRIRAVDPVPGPEIELHRVD